MLNIDRSSTLWFGRRAGLTPASRPRHHRPRRKPTIEPLEGRALLSTWTVNSLGDDGAGSGLSGDLRYCISQANQTSGPDVIDFSVTGTITLNSALPDLSDTTGLTDIEGPGAASLTVARSSIFGTPRFGIFSVDSHAGLKLVGLTVTGGLAYLGGGIDNEGVLTVTNCTIANNSALGDFINGRPHGGGGIYNDGTLTVTSCIITGNYAGSGSGGGIENDRTLSVTNSTIAGNSVGATGGGIFNGIAEDQAGLRIGSATVANSTIVNNTAYSGGGISNLGQLTLTNSNIASNSAKVGGGITTFGAWYTHTTLTVINSTIADNHVTSGGVGGGLDAFSDATATLYNTIVALNTSGTGGGSTPDDISLRTVVSSSSADNLIGTGGSGGLKDGVNGNRVGVADPGLGTLADNGGPTQTIALLPDSPAIDAGSNQYVTNPPLTGPPFYDQRGPGYPRIVHNTVDIGAFEFNGTILVVTAQPPASVTAGDIFGLTVKAEDSSGTVDSSFNGTVTVALSNNPGGASLSGTLTATSQNGVASFSDLMLKKAGTGYTLLVSASGLGNATTSAINVTPAAASQLVVTTQPPGSVVAGTSFSLVVSAEDPFNNVNPGFTGDLTVRLENNPGGASLSGTLTATSQNGVASFSDLMLDQVGIGYTLMVSASGLTDATTGAFNVQTTIATVGVGWGTQTAPLQTAADGLRLLPSGRNTDLPWLGIKRIQITLGQTATLAATDVMVHGTSTDYGPVTLSGSGTSYTITLRQAISGPDRVTITIGNGLIASFTRRLDVLPGDINDDGVVNSQDMVLIRNMILGWLSPTLFGDINGDGKVNIDDYMALRQRIGTHL
jgi:hypothetical protein